MPNTQIKSFLQVPSLIPQLADKANKRQLKGNRMAMKESFTVVQSSNADLAEISSLYSESCFEMESNISGSIYFGTWYKEGEGILYVRIAKAEGLASADASSINPYIKVFLLPGSGKQNKRRTGIQHRTNNPRYNEIVKVSITITVSYCK